MALCDYTAYSASKYAVRGIAEVLDMELRPHNIRVSISYPPETNTPMLQVSYLPETNTPMLQVDTRHSHASLPLMARAGISIYIKFTVM